MVARLMAANCCFNSRTPKGCDEKSKSPCMIVFCVSIHAPLKGATAEAIDLINRGTIAPFLREQMYYKKESSRIMLGNML